METTEGKVAFSFEINDNVTPVTDRMTASQERLGSKARETTNEFDRQRLKNIETMASLNAFRGGINQMSSSLRTLGIVDEQTYETMRKISAGFTLMTAGAESIKGMIGIMRALRAATQSQAVAAVFAAFANKPLLSVGAFAGAGVAAGAFLYSMDRASSSSEVNSSSATNNTTNITVNGTPSSGQRTVSAGLMTGSYY